MILLSRYKWYLVVALAMLAVGFFIGRANQIEIEKTVIEYLPGKEIRDSFYYPKPYEVVKPVKPQLPTKPDTIYLEGEKVPYLVTEKVDTAKIIEQFSIENRYRQTLFDNDTSGKLIISTAVQYNQQKNISYSFAPIHKVTTITKVKKNTFTPFVSASYNTLNYGGIGGGVFIKNVGFEYKYLSDFKGSKGHEGGIKLKF